MAHRTILFFLILMIYSSFAINKSTYASTILPNGCKTDTFLTITGNIGKTTNSVDKTYEISEQEFLAFPASTVTTSTPWTPRSDFAGPLLSTVLEQAQAKGNKLRLIAYDNFSTEVDSNYLKKYGAILADSKDGVRLTIRDFGPIFVIHPRDSFPKELDTPNNVSHLVWQLCRIEVE